MNKELKQLIIKWLLENEKQWQRVNSCREMIAEMQSFFLFGYKAIKPYVR